MTAATDLWDAQLADIYELTNRPELTTETALGLRMGTLHAHLSDHYPRDLVTTTDAGYSATASVNELAIATGTTFTRYRDVSAVKLLDVDGVAMDVPEVEIVSATDIYEYGYKGVKKPYIAWLAGTNLNVYAACGMYGAWVQWYQSPNVTRDTYDSWIAQLFPDVIVWEAARFVWNRTGNEAKAKEAYTTLHGTPNNPNDGLYALLKANYLHSQGR